MPRVIGGSRSWPRPGHGETGVGQGLWGGPSPADSCPLPEPPDRATQASPPHPTLTPPSLLLCRQIVLPSVGSQLNPHQAGGLTSTLPDHPPAGHSSCTLRPPPPGRAFFSLEPSPLTSLAPTSPAQAQGSCRASCALSALGKRPEESSAPGSPSLAPQPGHSPRCGVAPGLGRAEGEGLAVRSLAQPGGRRGRRAGMGLGLCGPPRRGPPGWPPGQGPPGWPQDKAHQEAGPQGRAPQAGPRTRPTRRPAPGAGPSGDWPPDGAHREAGPQGGQSQSCPSSMSLSSAHSQGLAISPAPPA